MKQIEAAEISAQSPRSGPAGKLRVLTLTPFYPSLADTAQGCFVAEPLLHALRLNISSEVMAAQPFYRPLCLAVDSAINSRWMRYFSLPGNLGLPTCGEFLAAGIWEAVLASHSRERFDLIHAHAALPCGHAASILSRKLKVPFVVSVHGLDVFSERQSGRMLAPWCRAKSAAVYRSARAVICVSDKVRQQVMRRVLARTVVIHNGVDAQLFSPAPGNESSPTILSVANLIPSKGHALLLRAFAEIIPQFPDWRLEIIGDGSERERLTHLAVRLGLGQRVSFIGRQSREAVAQAMRECAIFALPSGYEGLGCVYLEAMACGKPAIGCRGQGIEEVIEDGKNGLLVSPASQAELAEALRVLLLNEDFRRRLGAAARNTILQRCTLEHQARRFARLYRECLQ